jgi:predicted enzyme related to lactoylglutathione lyase
MSQPTRGHFVWHELMTNDVEGAKAFYTRVVGWGTTPFGEGDPPYILWTAGDVPVGGLMTTPQEALGSPPLWFQYLTTPDVDASAAQVTALGGTVHVQPRDIPEVGRFAVVSDPQGATFALFTPTPSDEQPSPPQVGRFSWFELPTTDPEAAFDFYAKLLDWRETDSLDMGEGQGIYQMFGTAGGDGPVGGIYKRSPGQPGPPTWIGYANVADINVAAQAIQESGGVLLYGPMEVPGGGQALAALDPQQAIFGLFSPPAA